MVPVLSLVFSVFSGVGHMVSRRQVRQELGTFPSVLTLESEGGWPGYPTPGHLEPEEQSLHSLFCSLLLIIFSFYLQSINILGTNSSSEDEKSRRTHPVARTEGFCPFPLDLDPEHIRPRPQALIGLLNILSLGLGHQPNYQL